MSPAFLIMKAQGILNTVYTGATSICTIKLVSLASAEVYSLFVQSLVATAAIGKMIYELLILIEKNKRERAGIPDVTAKPPRLPNEQKKEPEGPSSSGLRSF